MSSRGDVASIAQGQVGTIGGDRYWSAIVGGEWSGQYWCAAFASWVMQQAGVSCAGLPHTYCPTIQARAVAAGAVRPDKSQAQTGDIVLFDWDKNSNADHVGIVEANLGSSLQTIEGNVSNSVGRRTRAWGDVFMVIVPGYGDSGGDGATVTPVVASLIVDGDFGPLTAKATQACMQGHGYYLGCLVDGDWRRLSKTAMQQYLAQLGYYSRSIDGDFVHYSVVALQQYLADLGYYSRSVDGDWGAWTTRALQEALNDGRF